MEDNIIEKHKLSVLNAYRALRQLTDASFDSLDDNVTDALTLDQFQELISIRDRLVKLTSDVLFSYCD